MIAHCVSVNVMRIKATSHLGTLNHSAADLGILKTSTGPSFKSGSQTPVIAAVNGPCVTGGFEIALSCDIVLAAASAYFCDTHVKVGLLPGWGLSQRLPRLIGPYRAKELSLTARRLPATEAAAWGLVNHVFADAGLLPAALALARDIAGWPPENVAGIKRLIDTGYALPLAEALAHERRESQAANAVARP